MKNIQLMEVLNPSQMSTLRGGQSNTTSGLGAPRANGKASEDGDAEGGG